MMPPWLNGLSRAWLYGLLGAIIANFVMVAARKLLRLYQARQQLKIADEKRFKTALDSDSLQVLGSYLDTALGEFSIRDYSENAKVRERVTTFLGRLEDFVGKSTEITEKGTVRPKSETRRTVQRPGLSEIAATIESGRIWDGLAALRRLVEAKLTESARKRQIALPKRPGAGRVLQILHQHEAISADAAERLQFVIDVANRGVHGLDVSLQEALQALDEAQIALELLELVPL